MRVKYDHLIFLANKMFGYALLIALKFEHGFRPFLEGRHLEHLSYFFDKIDLVESLDVLCNEEKTFPWINSTDNLMELSNEELNKGKCILCRFMIIIYSVLPKLSQSIILHKMKVFFWVWNPLFMPCCCFAASYFG